jgi:dolichol-phosphate mannosyltransferase
MDRAEAVPAGYESFSPAEAIPSVSLIVPAYREAESLPALLCRVEHVRAQRQMPCEVLIIDDDSRDGTDGVIRGLAYDWVRLVVRKGVRGLSSAVLEGIRRARGQIVVVMDADLSHPPEAIPDLVQAVVQGADFALGSRYTLGGSIESRWSFLRRLNSRVATWIARPLTRAADPMSGFFAMRRDLLARGEGLDPIGYKIALELLVRCRCKDVREIPIHFAERTAGQSKLCFAEQVRYVRQFRRLLFFKYPILSWILWVLLVGVIFAGILCLA